MFADACKPNHMAQQIQNTTFTGLISSFEYENILNLKTHEKSLSVEGSQNTVFLLATVFLLFLMLDDFRPQAMLTWST